ncbi:MAG: DUF2254 domain-containing protein [Chloroflexales bacterium]|nr:DUF2254 domain-containing protein [Chloroflexales bacterium]
MGIVNTLSGLRAQIATGWEQLRTSFWFVPALMSAGAAVLALVTLTVDGWLNDAALSGLGWVYGGGPEGARSLLSTVASSAITVAGTTFSITIAALSLASSQFGPRLLRTFVRDTGNQVVLGTFVATFLYCLLVVRTVRGLEDTRVVPHLSVTVGVLLAITNLGVLIYFIHHVAMSIRADQVIAAVSHELDAAVEQIFPAQIGRGLVAQTSRMEGTTAQPAAAPDAQAVTLDRDGYLQVLDSETLMGLAAEHDLVVTLLRRPGDFVVAGEPVALAWPAERVDDEIGTAIGRTLILGRERSAQQDVRFVVNQLVEVAARALSPGINDPFTAITCLDRLGAVLCRVARRPLPDGRRYDDSGRLRMVAEPIRFDELVDMAFDQIRTYGREHLLVISRLLETIARIGEATADKWQHAPLLRQAALAYEGSIDALSTDGDRQTLAECYRVTLGRLNADARALV